MDHYNLPNNVTFLISQKALIWNDDRLLILKSVVSNRQKVDQWELPGGLLEVGESMAKGLKREVFEETNVQIEIKQLATSWDHWVDSFRINDGRVLNVRIVELAFQCGYVGGQVQLSEEHSAYHWCLLVDLNNYSFAENSRHAVERICRQS